MYKNSIYSNNNNKICSHGVQGIECSSHFALILKTDKQQVNGEDKNFFPFLLPILGLYKTETIIDKYSIMVFNRISKNMRVRKNFLATVS